MPSDLERRLERLLQADPEPAVEARLRAAALAALSARPARRRAVRLPAFLRARRRIGPLIVIGALVLGGGALAAVLLSDGSTQPRRAALVSPEAQSRLESTPVLADAPWLIGPGGPLRIDAVGARPSLLFPAGIGYRAALQAFYEAVSRAGTLPALARLGPPLPAGVVVRLPARAGAGLALDLRAPFGYDVPSGRIHPPAYASLRGATFPVSERYGTPLPTGAMIAAPRLRACQVMRGPRRPAPCPLGARPAGAPPQGRAVVSVPELVGRALPVALEAAVEEGLGLFSGSGAFPAYTHEAIARAVAAGHEPFGPSPIGRPAARPEDPPTLEDFRRRGSAAFIPDPVPGRLPVPVYAVRLAAAQGAPAGRVVGQFPAPGTRVRRGTPVVVVAVADDCLDAGLHDSPDCAPGALAARRRVPAIAPPLPWLETRSAGERYRIGDMGARPSLGFPAGTSHIEALRALYTAVVLRGALPARARLGPPLPPGVVLRLPARPGEGLSLSLGAPFGYDPAGGLVARPTLRPTGALGPEALRRLVADGRAALGLIRRRQSCESEREASSMSAVPTTGCPACGAPTAGLRARVPMYLRLDPLARAIAGRGLVICPECGNRWAADDVL